MIVAAFLALAVQATPAPAAAPLEFKSLGGLSCAEWPAQDFYTNVPKAVPLNFVLGLLAGRASVSGSYPLANRDVTAVSAFLDRYCADHPRGDIVQGALALEGQLGSSSPSPPPAGAQAAKPSPRPERQP